MKRLISLLLLFFVFSAVQQTHAQGYKKYLKDYLNTQFWMGVKFGSNLTQVNPVERYTGLSPINYTEEDLEKDYRLFSLPGIQAGLDLTFYYKGLSFGIQPNFRQIRYEYSNEFLWEGSGANDRFETIYRQEQKIDFIDVPLMVKYDILQSRLRPYVMGGAYISFITNAEKTVRIENTDYGSGAPIVIEGQELIVGTKEAFSKYDYGLMGGIGASGDFGNVRTVLEVSYRYGF